MDDAARRMTVAEYLEFEDTSDVRHEFHDGVLVPMTGASLAHNRLRGTLELALQSHLDGGPCEALGSDYKVHVESARRIFYPDVVVDCSEPRSDSNRYTVDAPVVIEILSPSTEAFDRGEKFRHYRALPSLREYVLVDSRQVAIDVFRRTDADVWQISRTLELDDALVLESIDFRMPVRQVYRRTDLVG